MRAAVIIGLVLLTLACAIGLAMIDGRRRLDRMWEQLRRDLQQRPPPGAR